MNAVLNFDFAILDFIRAHMSGDFADSLMKLVTSLGNVGILWIVIAAALLCTKKFRKTGLQMAVGLILGLIFGNLLLKNLVARPRPFTLRGTDIIIKAPRDYSFPSGHTLASVISAYILWHNNRKAGIAAAVTAALIAFSRIYLYVHYPTDIIGGTLLGLLIGFVTVKISESEKMRQMFRKKP